MIAPILAMSAAVATRLNISSCEGGIDSSHTHDPAKLSSCQGLKFY